MLMISVMLGIVVVLFAGAVVCIRRLHQRLLRVEKSLEMWKLAAEHWTRVAEERLMR